MKSSTKGIIAVISVLVVFAIVALIVTTTLSSAAEVAFTKIREELHEGNVTAISINNDKVNVKYKDGNKKKTYDEFAYAPYQVVWDEVSAYLAARDEVVGEAQAAVDEAKKKAYGAL